MYVVYKVIAVYIYVEYIGIINKTKPKNFPKLDDIIYTWNFFTWISSAFWKRKIKFSCSHGLPKYSLESQMIIPLFV